MNNKTTFSLVYNPVVNNQEIHLEAYNKLTTLCGKVLLPSNGWHVKTSIIRDVTCNDCLNNLIAEIEAVTRARINKAIQ